MTTKQDIHVSCTGSENVTSTVRGERASSTSSALAAAERLAEKLFGTALIQVTEVNEGNQFTKLFRAEADDEAWASCDDMGQIVVAPVVPVVNTALARGPHCALVQVMMDLAEPVERTEQVPPTAKQDRTVLLRLVPGVATAETRQAKDEAIHRWLQQHAKRNGKKGSLSCYFSSTVVRCAL